MSIVVKKIGNQNYAYRAYRQGCRVINQYLGPMSNEAVQRKVEAIKAEQQVPQRFRPLFWDTTLAHIDLKNHAPYVIERVLDLGDFPALLWLQRVYPTRLITQTLEISRKLSEKSKNFWRIWFETTDCGR